MKFRLWNLLASACIVAFCISAWAAQPPVPTPKKPVTDVYFGTKVVDDYQWLEDFNDPAVKQWVAEENAVTRKYLDALPQREAILKKLQEYYSHASPSYFDLRYRGDLVFARKFEPPKNQPLLVTLTSPNDLASERVVVDPNSMSASGSLSIDWYVPSLDGKLVAIAMSKNGSEDSDLYFFDTATGKQLPDEIPHVNYATAGGSAAWAPQNAGVYYTRYPEPGERPEADIHFYQQIYFHKLGTPISQDEYQIGKDFPRIAETLLQSRGDGKYVVATVANGDGGEFEHYVRTPEGDWKKISGFKDKIVEAVLGEDNALYLLSRNHAPKGKVLRLPLSHLSLAAARTIVPEGRVAIVDNGTSWGTTLIPTEHRLYVIGVDGGPSVVSVYGLAGKAFGRVPIPPISSVNEILPLRGDAVLLDNQTYLSPMAWYSYSGRAMKRTALVTKSAINFDDAVAERAFATSQDGTRVPLNIIHLKNVKLDGHNPALLTGYGGFDISMTPYFLGIDTRLWLDQGGVYAIANLRGGGEYGESWHQAGMLTKKQNVFDDFAACARLLIHRRFTSSAHLAIEGGSNGGLLMGAELTQHPELYRAVISHVGIYDMLRLERDPNGAFNTTEYGSVKDPEQFKALYAYSPYQHVRDKVAYPAVMFLTGDNDARVNPAHSRKMTAALQSATASALPVLLRTTSKAGHGFGTSLSEAVQQQADSLAFLYDQLGIKQVH